jgi:hypothetical protein
MCPQLDRLDRAVKRVGTAFEPEQIAGTWLRSRLWPVYNGWLATHPVQHIMRQYADRTGITAISFESGIKTLQALKDANAAVFASQPGLTTRLEQLLQPPTLPCENFSRTC